MLTEETIAIVKQTLPALRAHGEELTKHMYQRMFYHNPEVQAYFNASHQQTGSQQRALAAAICAYAEYIENPSELASLVEQIAQKHVSLSVKPEHYPIVGKHLLASIREVLGDAATDDVIDAWSEAYQLLADVFIDREKEVYTELTDKYGWQGFTDFVVTNKVDVSEDIVSLYLTPAAGLCASDHLPGQYITVRVPTPDGSTTMRNYSLSEIPGKPYYRISVKRERSEKVGNPVGYVSNYLHDRIDIGDRLEVSPPCGEFILQQSDASQKPLVFISGGIGITPLLSMFKSAAAMNDARDIIFIQCVVNGQSHAFLNEINEIEADHANVKVHIRYSKPTDHDRVKKLYHSEGFIDEDLITEMVQTHDAEYYFCGPKPMMTDIYRILTSRGVPEKCMHYEFFGPAEQLQSWDSAYAMNQS